MKLPRALGRWSRTSAPMGLVWLALVVVAVAPKWPGVFTTDSQAMYRSGLENDVSDWYAPLHAAAWSLTGKIGIPVWFVTVLGVGLFGLRSPWPTQYLQLRAGMYARLHALAGLEDDPFYRRSDELDWYRSSEMRQRWPGTNDLHTDGLLWFSESRYVGWTYAPIIYLLAGLGASAALIFVGRNRSFWTLVLGLQISLQAVLFVVAPVIRFRYQYYQVVLGTVLAIVAMDQLRKNRWSRHRDAGLSTRPDTISSTSSVPTSASRIAACG